MQLQKYPLEHNCPCFGINNQEIGEGNVRLGSRCESCRFGELQAREVNTRCPLKAREAPILQSGGSKADGSSSGLLLSI